MTAATSSIATNATVGGARALSVRIVTFWTGVWFADCDLDPDDPTNPPTGKVTIQVNSRVTLQGTVDPKASGRFVAAYRLRVLGGAGAWATLTTKQYFANDAGVSSTEVYSATASAIGETVNDPSPVTFPAYYVRAADRASAIFGDRDWYVDPSGVTQVQSRPNAAPDATLQILGFDGLEQRVEVACDGLVLPGTQLTDSRFDGTLTVRDVDQTFGKEGSRATLLCSTSPASRLQAALRNLVRSGGDSVFVKPYSYRFVSMQGAGTSARVNLQALPGSPNLPDAVPIDYMPGIAGFSAVFAPSTIVRVVFLGGAPSQPVVVGFDKTVPMQSTIDAIETMNVGPSAAVVNVAGGGDFLVQAIPFGKLLDGLNALAASLAGLATPPTPLSPLGAIGADLVTALAAIGVPATIKTKAT